MKVQLDKRGARGMTAGIKKGQNYVKQMERIASINTPRVISVNERGEIEVERRQRFKQQESGRFYNEQLHTTVSLPNGQRGGNIVVERRMRGRIRRKSCKNEISVRGQEKEKEGRKTRGA